MFLPHMKVHDISEINWDKFAKEAKAVKYVLFDKDNCVCDPGMDQYGEESIQASVEACQKAFGH